MKDIMADYVKLPELDRNSLIFYPSPRTDLL